MTGEASVTTCVADSGIGIAPNDQKRLFQKFFRADNTSTREAGGTGLGLVIAKTIVELLGGAIWVESEPGRGSRFYFTLPLFLETAETTAPVPVALPERGIGLVLIVDDDAYVRSLIRHALHRRGYGTLEAADSEEALAEGAAAQAGRHHAGHDDAGHGGPACLCVRSKRTARRPASRSSWSRSWVTPSRGELAMGAFSFLQKPLEPSRCWKPRSGGPASAARRRKVLAVCLPETRLLRGHGGGGVEVEGGGRRRLPVARRPRRKPSPT